MWATSYLYSRCADAVLGRLARPPAAVVVWDAGRSIVLWLSPRNAGALLPRPTLRSDLPSVAILAQELIYRVIGRSCKCANSAGIAQSRNGTSANIADALCGVSPLSLPPSGLDIGLSVVTPAGRLGWPAGDKKRPAAPLSNCSRAARLGQEISQIGSFSKERAALGTL